MIKKMLFIPFALLLFSFSALAVEKPADSMIRSVQGDLSRYEPMVARMPPGSRSAARVSRFVPIMESRLGSSRKKDSASWIETSKRLHALKQALLNIKEGKKNIVSTPVVATKASTRSAPVRAVAPVQQNMSDPDRARKVDALVKAFNRDFNRVRPEELGKDDVVNRFALQIKTMQAMATNFHDPSLGYVKQVKGFVVESEQYFHKRTDSIRAQIQANKKMQAGVVIENQRGQMAAAAENARLQDEAAKVPAQSEWEVKKLHRTFARAYSGVRGSLAYLNARTLANPQEAKDWKYRVDKLAGIVNQYQNKNHALAKQDIATYQAVKAQFDEIVKQLAMNAKENQAALLELQASNEEKQAAMQAQQHEQDLHRQFSNAYGTLGISLPYLTAETLADPVEASKWTDALKGMGIVVSQYQGMDSPEVKKNIAIYEEVKRKVEGGLSANLAASAGLSSEDLLRDHQVLEVLVVKYKPLFTQLDATNLASVEKVNEFKKGKGLGEIKSALASFSSKYGNDRRAIAKTFTLVNGGREWRSPENRVPESGFDRLSGWMNDLVSLQEQLNAFAENHLENAEKASDSKINFGVPDGSWVDMHHPSLKMARTDEFFARYRKTLDAVLKEHPERQKAKQLRAELDDVKRQYIATMNKAIDGVRWENTDDNFRGPGDVDELKDAAKKYLSKLGLKVLAISIIEQWEPEDFDVFKRPINYRLAFTYAAEQQGDEYSAKQRGDSSTAEVGYVYLTTVSTGLSLPFIKDRFGSTWNIRTKHLP